MKNVPPSLQILPQAISRGNMKERKTLRPGKKRNWFQFSTADQAVLNAAYDAEETQATLRHPKSGHVLVIDFERLEQTNITSGQVRALQVKDAAGKIVRSWDLEVYIQLRDATTRAEFDSDEDDAMTNLRCYLYWWAMHSQLAWEFHDPAGAIEGDTPNDTMERGIAAGVVLPRCEFVYGPAEGQGVFSWEASSTTKQLQIREKDHILLRRGDLVGEYAEPFEEEFEVITVNRFQHRVVVLLPQKNEKPCVPDGITNGMWRLDRSNDDRTRFALQSGVKKFFQTPSIWRRLFYGEIHGIERTRINLRVLDQKALEEYGRLLQGTDLDASQRGACVAAYERCATFVQGPPGTGKTGWAAKTLELLQKIEEFELFLRSPTKEELSMLAVAPTHIAVDTLLERVLKVAEDCSTGKGRIVSLRRFGRALERRVSDKHKSSVLPISLEQLSDEDDAVYRSEAKSAQILFGTIGGALFPSSLPVRCYRTVLVDEAAQAIEPEMLPLLLMLMETGRFVSVGDPDQLGAVVRQEYLRHTQFDRSLMARALHIPGMVVELLTRNYRSHPSIFSFSSRYIYGGALFVGGSIIR